MPKILFLRGLPGSGKSTFAKKLVQDLDYTRVNKDDLRAMLHNSAHSKSKEKLILKIRDDIITEAINNGKNVVVDDTNLHPKHETQIRELAKSLNAKFEINDSFLDIPVEICIQNDLKRINSVGEQVIKKMLTDAKKQFPDKFKQEKQEYGFDCNSLLPLAIIVDLDGTIALLNGRDPYDARTCKDDPLNEPVAHIVKKYIEDTNIKVIFMSGRSDDFREQTQRWLNKNGFGDKPLYMRKAGDYRKDTVIKKELFDEYVKK